jgi:hypothetical protein
MRKLRVGAVLGVGALVFAGCEPAFDGEPTGEQVGKRKVAVNFKLCESDGPGACADQGADGINVILIGFRVPRGTDVPEALASNAGVPIELTKNNEYKYHLNQLAPRNAERFKWFGYRSEDFALTSGDIETASFRVRMTLSEGYKRKRFKVRPVVGEMFQPNAEEVDCGESAYNPGGNPRATATCIIAPPEDQFDQDLAIPVKRPKDF